MSSREIILDVARASVAHSVDTGRPLAVDPGCYPASLREERATFVTLRRGGSLRGCVGSLSATRPLVVDVAENACAAACRDPRFQPVSPSEFDALAVQVSILSPPEPLAVRSEQELLELLRPKVDGLMIEEGGHRATFLPQVWELIPDSREFLRQLKRKAGLPADYWSRDLRVARYSVEKIEDESS